MMFGILGLETEKLPFQSSVSLGQDFHAGNANAFVFGLKSTVRACDIAAHHPPQSFSFCTNSFSCLEFPVFQSLRSALRITWPVCRVQHNSLLSANRWASLRLVNSESGHAFDQHTCHRPERLLGAIQSAIRRPHPLELHLPVPGNVVETVPGVNASEPRPPSEFVTHVIRQSPKSSRYPSS